MGGKIPKKRPKRLANLWNESKLYKKIHQNKNRPKRLANLGNESKLYKKIHQNKNRAKGKIPKRPQITSIFFFKSNPKPDPNFQVGLGFRYANPILSGQVVGHNEPNPTQYHSQFTPGKGFSHQTDPSILLSKVFNLWHWYFAMILFFFHWFSGFS